MQSHIANTLSTPGAAADQAAQQKVCQLSQHTHLLSHSHRDGANMECYGYRVGTGDRRHITVLTEDSRETTFLFQRLSMALQQGNVVSFQNTMTTE